MLDVVLAPDRALERGTDVPGRVSFVQGGSAANTARWLARVGARTTRSVPSAGCRGANAGRRGPRDGVHGTRLPRRPREDGPDRVLVAAGGDRTFVADRGAADQLDPADLRASWFRGPTRCTARLLAARRAARAAGRRAVELAPCGRRRRQLDLASIGPLLAGGRRAARALIEAIAPDLLFATRRRGRGVPRRPRVEGLLELAPAAAVKRGSKGATVLARDGDGRLRFEIATTHVDGADTTGAGDAFDAGFLVGWLARGRPADPARGAPACGRSPATARRPAS